MEALCINVTYCAQFCTYSDAFSTTLKQQVACTIPCERLPPLMIGQLTLGQQTRRSHTNSSLLLKTLYSYTLFIASSLDPGECPPGSSYLRPPRRPACLRGGSRDPRVATHSCGQAPGRGLFGRLVLGWREPTDRRWTFAPETFGAGARSTGQFIISARNFRKSSPVSGLVKMSAVISLVGQYRTFTHPFSM